MNTMWQYRQPVSVIFGAGTLDRLSESIDTISGSNGLLITSRSFLKNGTAQKLADLSGDRITDVFSEVSPNPDVSECDACTTKILGGHHDFVVALGGGSVIDCAKAASTFCKNPCAANASDYLTGKTAVPGEHLPVIAVPTTAGTGSEVTPVAVLSDHRLGLKAPMSNDCFYPKIALVDPMLTISAPPRLTACTGLDALCHAIEAFWSRHHQPVCDALAIHAASLILANLAKAVECPGDIGARTALAEASVTAGMAFAIPKTSAPHACAYPLTSILGIPHGEACALTLTWFMRFNHSRGAGRIDTLAHSLGYKSPESLATAIENLMDRTNMRRDLKDFRLNDDQTARLVKCSQHPNLLNNPAEITGTDLRELYFSLI